MYAFAPSDVLNAVSTAVAVKLELKEDALALIKASEISNWLFSPVLAPTCNTIAEVEPSRSLILLNSLTSANLLISSIRALTSLASIAFSAVE